MLFLWIWHFPVVTTAVAVVTPTGEDPAYTYRTVHRHLAGMRRAVVQSNAARTALRTHVLRLPQRRAVSTDPVRLGVD